MVGHEVRKIKYLYVHCSYTKPNMDIGVDTIRSWHVDGNGWSDIGYHDVIRRDGTIESGRPHEKTGAHAAGFNSDSIGVCLVGGMDKFGKPDANFTLRQYMSLKLYWDQMREKYPDIELKAHRDVSDKDCPCFDVHALL